MARIISRREPKNFPFTISQIDNGFVRSNSNVPCFIFYFGFEGLSSIIPGSSTLISSLGMQDHFKSMSRGVIDTRDVIYFLSITVLFLSFTVYQLKSFKA